MPFDPRASLVRTTVNQAGGGSSTPLSGFSDRLLAEREKVNRGYMCRVLRLMLLAPDLVELILDGPQGPEVTLARVLAAIEVGRGHAGSSLGCRERPRPCENVPPRPEPGRFPSERHNTRLCSARLLNEVVKPECNSPAVGLS